ncbi:alpha-galactosidase [Enterococcus casseliflavus]|uniref:alpha-galactosidase n=1 Tax=Enterococcus casseliflavus TaxID=37734 RepID=UPI003D0E5F93
MIYFQEKKLQFDLLSKHSQLSLGVLSSGHMVFYYFGKQVGIADLSYLVTEIKRASYLADTDCVKDFKLEQLPLAYPAYGNPDMRTPAFQLEFADGSRLSDMRYLSHEIRSKEVIPGLPTTMHPESESLVIHLFDEYEKIKISLVLSVFSEYDVFTQHVVFENTGTKDVTIERCMSVNLDFLTDDFDVLTLGGAWGRETHINRRSLVQGFQGVDSKRGASGHGQNPFIALIGPKVDDHQGEVYSFNLVYSGNFLALADVDMHQNTRVQLGINPFEFGWQLHSGESFATPEAVLVYAENGLNEMTQRYHRFYTDCLIPKAFATKERPIIINNWEATYFDFDKKTILALAKEGAQLGMELFVLDDGWFGRRSADDSSLGDWYPNEKKLGGSLRELIKEVNALGMDFGLWVEPEMVSPNSELYRQHPEWIIQVLGRKPQQIRNQYVLDLSRKEVQDYLIVTLSRLLRANPIRYIKWDMNRNITDSGSGELSAERQQELGHRYILGLYRILHEITTEFPEVLFESCAGGGGRFDPGMLAYTPQIWTSDNTDAIERLKIQQGTSLIYPQASMSCHVSAVPNHQVGRVTSLNTRGIVAQQGNFGYEFNLLELSYEEKKEIFQQINRYKECRETMQFGIFERLKVYNPENEFAWLQRDRKQVVVNHVFINARGNTVPKRVKLTGLKENVVYRIIGDQKERTGSELMQIGLSLPKPTTDYFATQWILEIITK